MSRRWIEKFELSEGKWVFVPTQKSVVFGKKLKEQINSRWKPPKYFYHLRNGGHVAAIRPHLQSRYFTKLDLSRFFSSITASRVTRLLKPLFGYDKARFYANESTVHIPSLTSLVLPYGFIQSMILASMALHYSSLGRYLKKLDTTENVLISVYVDDILISSKSKDILDLVNIKLQEKVIKSKLQLNNDKCCYSANQLEIFNIQIQHDSMQICDSRFDVFAYHYLVGNQFERMGIYNYIHSVNPQQALRLLSGSPP